MTYYYKPETLLLAKFNTANKLNLLPEHVRFENPRPADTVDITMSKVYNTAIDIVMQPGAPYDGTKTIFYNRVNLRTEFSTAKVDSTNYIHIDKESTLYEAIARINIKLGTRFTTDDIEDQEIDPVKMMSYIKLSAKPESLLYYGSVDARVYRATAKKVVINHTPSAIWVHDSERKRSAPNFGELSVLPVNYNVDYTAARHALLLMKVNHTLPVWDSGFAGNFFDDFNAGFQSQIYALKMIDGLPWVTSKTLTSVGTYNLTRSVCIYNGTTADCVIKPYAIASQYSYRAEKSPEFDIGMNPSNPNYKYVAVVLLNNPELSRDMYKSLVLFHYN